MTANNRYYIFDTRSAGLSHATCRCILIYVPPSDMRLGCTLVITWLVCQGVPPAPRSMQHACSTAAAWPTATHPDRCLIKTQHTAGRFNLTQRHHEASSNLQTAAPTVNNEGRSTDGKATYRTTRSAPFGVATMLSSCSSHHVSAPIKAQTAAMCQPYVRLRACCSVTPTSSLKNAP